MYVVKTLEPGKKWIKPKNSKSPPQKRKRNICCSVQGYLKKRCIGKYRRVLIPMVKWVLVHGRFVFKAKVQKPRPTQNVINLQEEVPVPEIGFMEDVR